MVKKEKRSAFLAYTEKVWSLAVIVTSFTIPLVIGWRTPSRWIDVTSYLVFVLPIAFFSIPAALLFHLLYKELQLEALPTVQKKVLLVLAGTALFWATVLLANRYWNNNYLPEEFLFPIPFSLALAFFTFAVRMR